MKKRAKSVHGLNYSLRPVNEVDADFIVQIRTSDPDRVSFMNQVSQDVSQQQAWITDQKGREGDYYFVIINNLSGEREGLIGLYDIENGKGEWGRWIITPGSLCSIESVSLLLSFAFDTLHLDEVYCRTIESNLSVVSFHDRAGFKRRLSEETINLNGVNYNYIEHVINREHYTSIIALELKFKSNKIYHRSLKQQGFNFQFHHIGIAVNSILGSLNNYIQLGYSSYSDVFTDEIQGVRGLFIENINAPRIELLENLEGSTTLNKWLDQGNGMYHLAYYVSNLDHFIDVSAKLRWKILKPKAMSVYFKTNICFFMLPNKQIIELIEKNE